MIHYKLLAVARALTDRPVIWITEFDDKSAADAAAEWLVENCSFRCTVVPDRDEHEQEPYYATALVDSEDEIADDIVVTLEES